MPVLKTVLCMLAAVFLFNTLSVAQVRLSGVVKDSAGQSLAGVSVTLTKADDSKIIRFAITDMKGNFNMQVPALPDTVYLKVSMLGYESKTATIHPLKDASFSFTLANKPVVLKEITVNKPAVWQKKDTINYDASSFKQPQDRTIGDVIARLPGIEVTSGGQIKYNGKPINKFYIEGLDLLEDKYGIATNSMPAEVVDKIQVLENHQPVKVLDSISFSDRAAMNIKLKDNAKAKLIARAKLGFGASPLLSEDELSAMLFKKNLQFLNTYKFNNTGINYTKELTSQNFGEYMEAVENGGVKTDLLSVVQPANPPLGENRYLFNSTHAASINQLLPLNSTYQLRLNASYLNDHRKLQSNTVTRVYLPSDTVNIDEKNNFVVNNNTVQCDLALLANTPKYYFKNVLQFQGWWSEERNNLIAMTQVDQTVSNPFYNVLNDLRVIWTKHKRIFHFKSYTGIVALPQQLQIVPGIYEYVLHDSLPYDKLSQNASLKAFYTDNSLGFTTRFSRIAVDHKFGFNVQSQRYNSDLLTELGGVKQSTTDSFQNSLQWKRERLYFENTLSYQYKRLKARVTLPMSVVRFRGTDPGKHLNYKEDFFVISPSANLIYQINSKWEFNSVFLLGYDYGDYSNITRGYVLKTYRNLVNNNSPIAENRDISLSTAITFRNPVKAAFFHNGIRLSRKKSNLLYSQRYNGSLETMIAQMQDNNRDNAVLFGRFSKYFIPFKTSLVLSYNYTLGRRELLQQHVLSVLSNRSYSVGIGTKSKISNKLTADYNNNFFKYMSGSQYNEGSSLSSFSQSLVLNFFPAERVILKGGVEHYSVGSDVFPIQHYFFADMALRYTIKRSKTDFEFVCQNITNTKAFVSGFLSDNIETITKYQLRPRQFLIKANFSF